jgi:hypothetical protein
MRALITTSSVTLLSVSRNSEHTLVYLAGTMGSATVNICYRGIDGGLIPFKNGANVSLGDQYTVTHGDEITPELEVVGADSSTDIDVNSVALQNLLT